MTIKFADGTRIEVQASAYDDFVKHDLKWVEFVHGRAATSQVAQNFPRHLVEPKKQCDDRCPARTC